MKKCKHCKQPFQPYNSLQKYCSSSECVKVWIDVEKEKKWKKEKEKKKTELMTVQDYIKIAQQVVNKYINHRDKGLPCISCDKLITGRVNASHFWNANNHWNVRFDEDNIHSSCITCNQHLSGNLLEYQKRLITKIGQKKYDELEAKSKITRKYSREELKEIIEIYRNKIKLF